MIQNIQITKNGSESDDSLKTIFSLPEFFETNGENLIVYKNNIIFPRSDYTVLNEYTIKLNNPISVNDKLDFYITKITDPSNHTTYNERMHQLDRINKQLDGKVQTSITKRINEETISSKLLIHSNDVWTTQIPTDTAVALLNGIVISHIKLLLTEDKSVPNHRGWYASKNAIKLTNWVPPIFGKDYTIRLYDSTNKEILSSDNMNWHWNYQAGYLVIENVSSHVIPYKVTGYQYAGKTGVGSNSFWKEPIFSVSELPQLHNDDGDVRLVTTENKLYRFDSIQNKWERLNYGSDSFKDPVTTKSNLPLSGNIKGDIILVMDEWNMYVWDDAIHTTNKWSLLTGHSFDPDNFYLKSEIDDLIKDKAAANHSHDTLYHRKEQIAEMITWEPSRASFADLPPWTENNNGDIRLTRDTNSIWRWYTENPNTGIGHWEEIVQSNFSWKAPLQTIANLPPSGNAVGDIRLIIQSHSVYFWDGVNWIPIITSEENVDYDAIYVKKNQLRWLDPVATLPLTGNYLNDIRLNTTDNIIYNWNGSAWNPLTEKIKYIYEPVNLLTELPTTAYNNAVIYIQELNELYVYVNNIWKPLKKDYYTKQEINNLINQPINYNDLLNIPVFYWKNPVNIIADLPTDSNTIGDARIVIEQKSIHIWTGTSWNIISGGNSEDNDLTQFYTKSELDEIIVSLRAELSSQINNSENVSNSHLKEPVIDTNDLPTSGNSIGDIIFVKTNNSLYIWNNNKWNALSSSEENIDEPWVEPLESTNLIEPFNDEKYRLLQDDYMTIPLNRINVWTGGDSNSATINAGKLEGYNKNYYRSFLHNTPHNNGCFVIKNITKDNLINEDVKIDIKLPSITGWLSMNKSFDINSFTGKDNDGCLVKVDGDRFYVSFGEYSTVYSGHMIIVRITLASVQIEYMELLWR
jgi:hypothetical protein